MAIVADRSGNSKVGIVESLDANNFDISPSDTAKLQAPVNAIFTASGGDIRVENSDGSTATFTDVPAGGTIFVGAAVKVHDTGTDATGLVGIVSKGLR